METHKILWKAGKFIEEEDREVELSTIDSNKSRRYASMFDDKPWRRFNDPQHRYDQAEAEFNSVRKVPQAAFNI